jgi:hypothetical protein
VLNRLSRSDGLLVSTLFLARCLAGGIPSSIDSRFVEEVGGVDISFESRLEESFASLLSFDLTEGVSKERPNTRLLLALDIALPGNSF